MVVIASLGKRSLWLLPMLSLNHKGLAPSFEVGVDVALSRATASFASCRRASPDWLICTR